MKRHLIIYIAFAATAIFAAISCKAPFTPSNYDAFLQQENECLLVGKKIYIGGEYDVQTSYNPTRHLFRVGNIETVKDTVSKVTYEMVNDYFAMILDGVPGETGSTIKGYIYLKHHTLPNTSRTYGSETNPAEFTVARAEGEKVWLWSEQFQTGAVISKGGK